MIFNIKLDKGKDEDIIRQKKFVKDCYMKMFQLIQQTYTEGDPIKITELNVKIHKLKELINRNMENEIFYDNKRKKSKEEIALDNSIIDAKSIFENYLNYLNSLDTNDALSSAIRGETDDDILFKKKN